MPARSGSRAAACVRLNCSDVMAGPRRGGRRPGHAPQSLARPRSVQGDGERLCPCVTVSLGQAGQLREDGVGQSRGQRVDQREVLDLVELDVGDRWPRPRGSRRPRGWRRRAPTCRRCRGRSRPGRSGQQVHRVGLGVGVRQLVRSAAHELRRRTAAHAASRSRGQVGHRGQGDDPAYPLGPGASALPTAPGGRRRSVRSRVYGDVVSTSPGATPRSGVRRWASTAVMSSRVRGHAAGPRRYSGTRHGDAAVDERVGHRAQVRAVPLLVPEAAVDRDHERVGVGGCPVARPRCGRKRSISPQSWSAYRTTASGGSAARVIAWIESILHRICDWQSWGPLPC